MEAALFFVMDEKKNNFVSKPRKNRKTIRKYSTINYSLFDVFVKL